MKEDNGVTNNTVLVGNEYNQYEAGKKAGRKEVVSWFMEEFALPKDFGYWEIELEAEVWHRKLGEWGLANAS